MSIVIVQHITTVWSKHSRGGAEAVKRNAVPEVTKLPIERIPTQPVRLLVHTFYCVESKNFSPAYEEIVTDPTLEPYMFGCVTISPIENAVLAEFRYRRDYGGAPGRGWARKTLRMANNEWGQIVYNGRFTPAWEGNWWYEKKVVNVGLFEQVLLDIFTRESPAFRFDASAHLF